MLAWFNKKKKAKLPARVKGNVCLNCEAILEGEENFCPECGQRNNSNPLNFNLVVNEFFGNLFAYDSRLWNTVIPLLTKPGKTAYDYIYGKRQSLVNPFRIYLAISLIFFLFYGLLSTFFSLPEDDTLTNKAVRMDTSGIYQIYEEEKLVVYNDSLAEVLTHKPGVTKRFNILMKFHRHNPPQTTATILKTLKLEPTRLNRFMIKKAGNFGEIFRNETMFQKKLFSGLSLTIFLILPLFALVLKLIYVRRKYSYMEHLVFVFYTQSVFFLLLLLFTLAYYTFGHHNYYYLIFVLLFIIYLFIAMRRFYRQGKFKTFLKFTMANMAFLFLSALGLLLLTIISFITY